MLNMVILKSESDGKIIELIFPNMTTEKTQKYLESLVLWRHEDTEQNQGMLENKP